MEVRLTQEQESRLTQMAEKAGTDPERLVKDVVLRYLDEESFERATLHSEDYRREPGEPRQIQDEAMELTLRPYAMARIDLDGST